MEMKPNTYYFNLLKANKLILENKYGITRIGIFGSVARGEHKDNSDVDICVDMKKPDLFLLIGARDELQKIFKCKVDIVRIRENMNPFLLKTIKNTAIYA